MAFHHSFDSPAAAFGRRRFLMGALGSGVVLARAPRIFAAEFWNSKDPSAWTDEEVVTLTSKSPWARLASPDFKGADDPTEASNGGPAVGGRGGTVGRRSGAPPIVVRWESAQPILDALKTTIPAEFAGHYVLSVTNLPGEDFRRPSRGGDKPDDTIDRLQNGATLQAKGKDAAEAGIARRTRIGSILFGFSRDYLRLTSSDRDILFTLTTGVLTIKAKFDGKDMTYHGKLAV